MDELKKYLRDHRADLDVEAPPRTELWQSIQQQVDVRRKPVMKPVYKWVAAAGLIVMAGATMYLVWMNEPGSMAQVEPTVTEQPIPEITGRTDSSEPAISPLPGEVIAVGPGEKTVKQTDPVRSKPRKLIRPALPRQRTFVDELQENYATIIRSQLKKLESTPIHVESANYFHAFKKQWIDMEKDEAKLKEDIVMYGMSDMTIGQFIQLYQQKLLLLKQLQDEINQMNNRAHRYPEIQRKSPSYLKM